MAQKEEFSNRWGIVLASLGMAIGAGNLWRFPRLAGQYGGTFLILWVFFLLIWSVPLLLVEFSLGKKFKHGVITAISKAAGKKYTWAGFFITMTTLGIAFYYSVVTGWAFRYFLFTVRNFYHSITGADTLADRLKANPDFLQNFWQSTANGHPMTILFYALAVVVGCYVLIRGIQSGLEKVNRVLIPSLFILLLLVAGFALSMKKGIMGLEYMFSIDPKLFSNPRVWIEAVSQSAWSTGAGWGLMLTIASYSRSKEDITLNTFLGAFGNNTASLIAGMAILPSVFALAPSTQAAEQYLQQGNQALTFTIIPQLFSNIPGGPFFAMVFFGAFFVAAFSSLLPMLELFIRNLTDLGVARKIAGVITAVACVIFGLPSAMNLDVFTNQDWVWGLGLIVTGFLMAVAVLRYGLVSFKKDLIDTDSDFIVPLGYFKVGIYTTLVLGVVLVIWWMSQGYSAHPWFNEAGNWNLLDVYSNATIVTQWGIVLLLGILLNGALYKWFVKRNELNG